MTQGQTFEGDFWTKHPHLAHRDEQRTQLDRNAESLFAVLVHQLRAGDVARIELSNDEGATWRKVAVTAGRGQDDSLSWKKVPVPASKVTPKRFKLRWTLNR